MNEHAMFGAARTEPSSKRRVLLAIITAMLLPCAAGLGQDLPAEHARAVSALKQRQDYFRTASFYWRRHYVRSPRVEGENPVWKEPKGLEQTAVLRLDGKKLAYSNDSPQVASDADGFRAWKSTFDGETVMTYFNSSRPAGRIGRGERSSDYDQLSLKAVLLALRPLDEDTGGFDLGAFKPYPNIQVDGNTCIGFTADGKSGLSRHLWVDPLRNYTVARFVEAVNRKPVITLNIQYHKDEKHGWLPDQWSYVWVNPETDNLVHGERAQITSYEINLSIPADEFKIEFPPGTLVRDHIKGTQYIAQGPE